jgi:phosphoribosyl 1,2-cyclic phosphodiesterase
LKRFEESEREYENLLKDQSSCLRGSALRNLGFLHLLKNDHRAALKIFKSALKEKSLENPGAIWTDICQVFRQLNKLPEARVSIEKALQMPMEEGQRVRARGVLALLKADLRKAALSADDRALLENPTGSGTATESRILEKIKVAEESQYDRYLKRSSSNRDAVLSVLRGWSSAVTLLEGSERLWRGGGYFLKWRGYGIVIDPGFDFLRNFHDADYHGREINAVLISHNHPDHNADLRSIDDLRYELYKRRNSAGNNAGPYSLIWDIDSRDNITFPFEKPEHQLEPILFDTGLCQPENTIKRPHGLPFNISYFKARHTRDVPHAVAFCVNLLGSGGKRSIKIGYTGDTEYFPELADYFTGCDVLVAHISQPTVKELTDPSSLKEGHLGYRGLSKLIHQVKSPLTIVGEFWAGLADLRIDLVQGLRVLADTQTVLPAGLGLHLDLESLQIECNACFSKTDFQNVKVAPPATEFGNLGYLCPGCFLG